MTTTDTSLCINCGKAAADQLQCSGCGVVQPVERARDHFSVFGLPRRLVIDPADLEHRYFAISRQLHPDRHQGASPAEQAASVRATALVTRAYRELRDPVKRALHWLGVHGESLGRDNERVPAELAALVFEVQEKLEELRDARRDGGAAAQEAEMGDVRAELAARMHALETELADAFARSDAANGDGGAVLPEIKRILSSIHYVRTLIRDVDKELEPQWIAS